MSSACITAQTEIKKREMIRRVISIAVSLPSDIDDMGEFFHPFLTVRHIIFRGSCVSLKTVFLCGLRTPS